jgi:DNA-binding PadR family transcriptional regulator
MPPAERPLAEWVCLALVDEAPTHGWAVARTLAPEGDVGRIWSLSRPLTYRAIDRLVADGLVVASGVAPGSGPARTMLRTSPAGRRAARSWLRQPVAHLRDVRTELLCKLVLAERRNASARPLLDAQRQTFAPAFEALTRRARARDADVVDRWRHESSEAVRAFLDRESRRR